MGFSRVKVYEDDKTWAWKFILRILAILFNITGIALTAWALSTSLASAYDEDGHGSYYYGDQIAYIPWNLITFSLSFIWCLTNICILLSRSRPIHPGANVGCDLFLWLCFIVTGFFSVIGAISALGHWYASDDSYYNSYDNGDYAYYPNGTSYIISPTRPAPECPGYDSCAQKNDLEASARRRGAVIVAASAFALLMVLVHFALFISACRYTHHHRRQRYAVTNEKITKEATVIAREIIAQMAQEGRIPPPAQQQYPLAATNGGGGENTRGAGAASLPSTLTPVVQPQQPVPQVVVHGAGSGPGGEDGIEGVPRGTAL